MRKDHIDVIIPCFKAHKTIFRALSSIACQTIISDVSVVIVNDCCPEGDYQDVVKTFEPYMDIREVKMAKNGGAGLARQLGIDSTDGEFFTCVDADDALCTVKALETLRSEIQSDSTYMVAASSFDGLWKSENPERFCKNMVWMFGKMYRRSFIEKYNIRFCGTRANEDTGFNRTVYMLCDNPQEQIRYVPKTLYMYSKREDSITHINGQIYFYDQGACGVVDSMIYAFQHVRKYKPFSGFVMQEIVQTLVTQYWQYIRIKERVRILSIPFWEYCKKFYHQVYKSLEAYVTDDAFRVAYTIITGSMLYNGDINETIPGISAYEFLDRLRKEPYDPEAIKEIYEELSYDPEYQKIMANNKACGVVAAE